MKPKDSKNIPVPAAQPPIDQVYSLEQAAEVLHINDQTLVRKLRAKELVGHKKHGRWFVLHSDIINYIRS